MNDLVSGAGGKECGNKSGGVARRSLRQILRRLRVQRRRIKQSKLDAQKHQKDADHEELIAIEFHGIARKTVGRTPLSSRPLLSNRHR